MTKISRPNQVYRNLRTKKWSVQSRDGSKTQVVMHADNVYMGVCQLVVGKKGNERVRLEQRKNVHAFVRGILLDTPSVMKDIPNDGVWVELTYNPYKHKSFVVKATQEPVSEAAVVVLRADGSVWAANPV